MMNHSEIKQAKEKILGKLYRAPGRFRKCDFYTMRSHNGELSADEVSGWTDGVFFYYKIKGNAWFVIVPGIGICFTKGKTREDAQKTAFNCISVLREKMEKVSDKDRMWEYYELISTEPTLEEPDCYDDVKPKAPRYQVVVWTRGLGSDEMCDFHRLSDAVCYARKYAANWSYAAVYDRQRKRALVIFGDVLTPVFSDSVKVSAYSGK